MVVVVVVVVVVVMVGFGACVGGRGWTGGGWAGAEVVC